MAQQLTHSERQLLLYDSWRKFRIACEPVKHLPAQNGDEEWENFNTAWQQLLGQNLTPENLSLVAHAYATTELRESPLFEILFHPRPIIRPPTTLLCANPNRGCSGMSLSAAEFIDICIRLNNEFPASIDLDNPLMYKRLLPMVIRLADYEINVLDFLSTELTDEIYASCPLLRIFVQTLQCRHSHAVFDVDTFVHEIAILNKSKGHEHDRRTMHVPPYPAQSTGLDFDHTHMLAWMRAAQLDMVHFDIADKNALESFDILHYRIHQMLHRKISIAQVMEDRAPPPDSPGHLIYSYLVAASNPYITCSIFFAHVHARARHLQYRDLTQEDAEAYVETLEMVDVAYIPPHSMRCSHCWCDYDQIEPGLDNRPVRLPCDPRHMMGRDCLIETLVRLGSWCPFCQIDWRVMKKGERAVQGLGGELLG